MYFFHTQNFTSQLWKIQEIHSKKKKKRKKKEKEKGSRDLPKKHNPDVLQILPEAKVPYTLTGSGLTDKEGLSSDSTVQWSLG